MTPDYYTQLTERNGFFIKPDLQKKIRTTKLVFIGCGLASNVAVAAARLGFENFVFYDGDTVEAGNLNRQSFYVDEIGTNKAKALSERVKKINPESSIVVYDKFVDTSLVTEAVSSGDIIINSADFNEIVYAIEEESTKKDKLCISPLNIGFGSVITAFTNKSDSLKDMTGGIAKNDKEFLLKFYKGVKNYKLPDYIGNHTAAALLFVARRGFFPQNVIAAEQSTVIILNAMLKYLRGEKIKTAPQVMAMDPEGVDGNST